MKNGVRSGAAIAVGGPTMGATWSVAGVGDFNDDGTSDILWRNAVNGNTDFWTISKGKFFSAAFHNSPGAGYSFKGIGDFNGDGVADVLWQNASTHELIDWQMAGGKVQSAHTQSPPSTWTYEGTGDFRGNGTTEALFANSNHALVALNLITDSSFSLGVSIPTNFVVDAIGDYNNDGVSDVMIYDKANGALEVSLGALSGHSGAWTGAGTIASPAWKILA
jgi:hypothetical protein